MGQILAEVELENTGDRTAFEDGFRAESDIRRTSTAGIVDTGAVTLVLPQNIAERLGLRIRRTVVVTYADERKEERPVAGPVTIQIGDRFMSTDCIVGPPFSETLIGQVVRIARSASRQPEPDAATENAGLSPPESKVTARTRRPVRQSRTTGAQTWHQMGAHAVPPLSRRATSAPNGAGRTEVGRGRQKE